MEFHSHLAYTEIIGLLGGRVVQDENGSKQLKVEYVFPCRSTSTGIQVSVYPLYFI
jgi:protein MYSM1